ncbi:hypothetical protein ABZT03_38050 [Streptomyces sp. NPDC005574]|uniref:hypothetical protein n=1 Tax=Streptomyces sp. NPDC005574 TaxID=3156891 RepID=UPI0033B2567C
MNTERPDNDDAAGASGTGGASEGAEASEAVESVDSSVGASEGAEASEAVESVDSSVGATEGAEASEGGEAKATPKPASDHADAVDDSEGADGSEGSGSGASDTPAAAAVAAEGGAEASATGDAAEAEEASGTAEAEEASGTAEAEAPHPDAAVVTATTAPAPVSGNADADAGHPPHAPDLDPASAEPARRRSPLVVASVAAAVLLVGGGGAYFAATASGGSGGADARPGSAAPGSDGTPPPLLLEDSAGQEGGTNGIAPGEPNPYGVTYRAAGTLPDGPSSAPVYRAKGEVTRDEVARLAKALGVDGTPVVRGQDWQVGPVTDGAGPSLRVGRQAPGAWTFHRYLPGTDSCKSAMVCADDPANPAGDTVGEEAAKKAAAPVLKAVGQDDAKVDASRVMGAQRVVNADPVIGGLPTYGWTTGLTVSADGQVIGGSGRLEAPVKSDTYPVLGADETLDRMNTEPVADHRMGIGGCASPVPLGERLEAPCGSSTSTSAPKSPAAPTATPARNTITVDTAVFGLAAHVVDGRAALVPSWLFGVRASGAQDAFTVTHPAVDPAYLTTTDPAAPSDGATSTAAPRPVAVDGYTAEGKELTVAFTGGVCADYKVSAGESAVRVTVEVTATPWPDKVCIMIAKQYHKTVRLDAPLGDRKVVDADGAGVPLEKAGARLPATTEAR